MCGEYVLGPVLRLGAWVSVFLARRADELNYAYEARVVHVEPSDDPVAAAALHREAALLMELRHPSIPRVVAVGVEASEPLVISERPEGRTLREIAAEGGADLALSLRVVSGVVGALDALHGRDPPVVHRRISPEVIVVSDDRVWLEECGLAHVLTRAGWLPEEVSTVAPEYLTPEELQRHASPRSDVFALATVVFEALTGTAPFAGDTDAALSLAIMVAPRLSASEVSPNVLPELDAVFHRAWARDAREGFTATDFAAAFESALESAAQRIARERAAGREPVATLTPLRGYPSAPPPPNASPTASRPPVAATRPPPLPRATTRPHGTESHADAAVSAPVRRGTGSSASARPRPPVSAELEKPVEMPSAVRTLQPSPTAPDDPDVTQRRAASVERRESLAGPMPAATGSAAPSATSTRPPDRSESDRPTLPPRPRSVAPERDEALTAPVAVKTQPAISPQAARTLGVAIVLAALIVSLSQVYIARSTAPSPDVTGYALRPTAEPREPQTEPVAVTPVNVPAPSQPVVETHPPQPVVTPPAPPEPAPPVVVAQVDAAVPSIDASVRSIDASVARPSLNLPARPTLAELTRVRTEVHAAIQRCVLGQGVGPFVQVVALYAGPSGRAFRVDITGRANQEPMGACIESSVMRWPLARFAAPVWRVEYGVPIAAR